MVGTARKTVLGGNVPDDIKEQRGGQAGGIETWGPREDAGFYLSDMARQEGYEPERDGARSSSQAPTGCRRGTDWGWNRSRGTREKEGVKAWGETRVTVPHEDGRGEKWAGSGPATKVETAGLAEDQRYLL